MSWVKEANKLGKYEHSYKGFRIYCTREPIWKDSFFTRDDELWKRTDLTPGEFLAINKDGHKITWNYVDGLWGKIDFYYFKNQ